MRSLRARLTLVSTAVLLIVLALAGLSIVELVERQLRNELVEQNEQTLTEIATRIETGEDPAAIRLPLATDGTEFIVSTADGVWVNSTLTFFVGEGPPIEVLEGDVDIVFADGAEVVFDEAGFEVISAADQPWDVRTTAAAAPDGSRYVIEALSPTTVVDRTVSQVRSVLWLVIPVLAAVFAALAWLLTGRLLSPVDQMTARARRIRTDTLHERLDEPGTDDEIDRLAQTLNGMLDRLERGARAQQQFVSDAAHELQSPLTVLVGEAELAAATPTRERLAAANERVVTHGRLMRDLIQDLLDLARAEESTLRRTEVDLDDLVVTEARRHRSAIETGDIQPVKVHGDPASLARVVRNLLDNAERHGGGRVRVACQRVDGRALVVVDDDGPGVPVDQRQAVFERFARIDESRTRTTGGTGLGLAIVKAVVEGHGGTIEIGDSPLGGARLTVMIPTVGQSRT
ncbi:MAG: ATP-binding protein [Actinomycetota bacterium]